MAKIKIAIGITVYNDSYTIQNLINSILTLTDFPKDDYKIVILDDGSKDASFVRDLRAYLDQLEIKIPILENGSNKGLPYSWNRLTEYYDTEFMVLANDDTQVLNKHWLKYLVYFLENNPNVGAASFPMLRSKLNSEKPTIFPVYGYFFGFKKSAWKMINQPDGSTGFWEDLRLYFEEIDFSFELAKHGFLSCILPVPAAIKHISHVTVTRNPELDYRYFSTYVSKEEYLSMIEKSLRKGRGDKISANKLLKKYLDVSLLDIARALKKRTINKASELAGEIDGMPCIVTEKLTGKDLACKRFYNFCMFSKKWNIDIIDIMNADPTIIDMLREYQGLSDKNRLKWLDRYFKIFIGHRLCPG